MREQVFEGFRLSLQQKRVWAAQQDRRVFRAQCAVLLEGSLDKTALKRAVEKTVIRHEILRTRFHYRAGMKAPFQVVTAYPSLSWRELDLTGRLRVEQDQEIERLFEQQDSLVFDLENDPLLSLTFFALSHQEHVLSICLPALCADSVSLNHLVHELSCSYAACLQGESVEGEVVQYADFSGWQEDLLDNTDEDGAHAREYWREQGASPALPPKIPFRFKQSNPESGVVRVIALRSDEEGSGVERTAKDCGATASEFLLSCWLALLWRVTGQAEFVSTAEFSCRNHEELKDSLGLFAQALPVTGSFDRDCSFRQLLLETRIAAQAAEKWHEYVSEDASSSLSAAGFSYQEYPSAENAAGISFSMLKKRVSIRGFDLHLRCNCKSGVLTAEFEYDDQLFAAEDVERLAGQFHTLLRSAAADPDKSISRLDILDINQRREVLSQFNETGVEESNRWCIHERFQECAARAPSAAAVVYEDERWTYEELDRRTNQLARYLRELGVGPDSLVGICLNRSLDNILAMLGVLKAGGAYVPLDPGLPKGRLDVILNDVRAKAVLTRQQHAGHLQGAGARVICLDTDWSAIADHCADRVESGVTSSNLAYVLFTSGSTGTPKGVAIEHRQLANYLNGIFKRLDLSAGASFATVSTFAADLGNTAIFPALCGGGCLHVISEDRAKDPDGFAEYFARHSIDCLKIVPSHLRALLTSSTPEHVLPKRRLVLGGEAASWDLIQNVKTLSPDCVILNHYGPTETTVGTATYLVDESKHDQRTSTVPIGRPIINSKIYILDSNLEPVPVWSAGEIYVGGAGLARGYLNGPGLSGTKFIPDPFSGTEGARLYRTGDLGRYLPDGSIEFLGRTDHQVKIRGFRIELGEIHAVLKQHDAVHDAAVIVREELSGDKQIAAYVVCHSHQTATGRELRDFLRARLPAYMLPAAVNVLDALPLTPNGKLDRAKLPVVEPKNSGEAADTGAPRTSIELVLAKVWGEMPGLAWTGVDGDFFDLGGHSLLAMQFISRVRQLLRVELPLKTFFDKPTASALAAAIVAVPEERARIENTAVQVLSSPELSKINVKAAVAVKSPAESAPLSLMQEQLWFIDRLEPGSSAYNTVRAYRIRGPLKVQALEQSLTEIVRRHECLRAIFAASDGMPVQTIAADCAVTTPIVDLRTLPESEREARAVQVITDDAHAPFDLAEGPLVRCMLLRLSDRDHVFFVAMHHIVIDGWSWGVFARELSALYNAFSASAPSPLEELPFQYSDFAKAQRQSLRKDVLAARRSYWAKQLDGAPPLLELPVDYPRGRSQSSRGAVHSEMLTREMADGLKALSRQAGATLFMTACAAFNAFLSRWTGQEDILIGSVIAGRDRPESEKLIGPFINTLVLRTDVSGNPTFRELLRRVREVALGAYGNSETPAKEITGRLQNARSMAGSPFQVLFALDQGIAGGGLQLNGAAVSEMNVETKTVKFELSVAVTEKTGSLSLSFEYKSDLFDITTIQRMVSSFQALLGGIIADPDARLSELPVWTHAQLQQLLVGSNASKSPYPRDRSIHDLVEKQVARIPAAVAVVSREESLSYQDLDRRANQLARHLRGVGVSRGDFVGVLMERSAEMVVALLGVLKAGAAYVPLDPAYPKERLEWVLTDTQASVLLTQSRNVGIVNEHAVRVICLDSDWGMISLEESSKPIVDVSGDDLAYVIYTSGSTGRPKGVEITHGGLANHALSTCESFELSPEDRVLQFASIGFDVAAEEIFPTLIRGAAVILRTSAMLDSIPQFLTQCSIMGITVLNVPTAFWHEWTEQLSSAALPLPERLRLVVIGGERAKPERMAQWHSHVAPRVRLLNEYGPTETTVGATIHECTGSGFTSSLKEIPIGRPIANTQTYVLDQHLNLAPVGVRGELYIGGAGLARGYHQRPDLTAESFVPDPFSEGSGSRLYRTGDAVRLLPDGVIEFAGRLDDQVKIRGFRIELGEIEARLTEHKAVRHAIVCAREDQSGENCLAAYIVAENGDRIESQELRSFLKQRLPEYMLPSDFLFLDSLPLTPNGKVDVKALVQAGSHRAEPQQTYAPPRTAIERQLTEEWESLIGVRPIGIRDSFFDLGGHSLLAVRLVARIEKRFGRSLPVSTLFQSATIEELAFLLEQSQPTEIWSSLGAIQPHGSKPPFFWVHGELSGAILMRHLGGDQPLYGLDHQSLDGRLARYVEVETIAAHYLKEVRTVQGCGPYFLGGYCFGAVVAFEMAQQLRNQGEEVALLFMLDPSGDLVRAPLPPLHDEVQRHLQTLALLGFADKLKYVLSRAKTKLDERASAVTKILQRLISKACEAMGRSLPASTRSEYILEIYGKALDRYVPQSYPGPGLIYTGEGRFYAPPLDWPSLIRGGVEVHQGEGGHRDMTQEPCVGVWAERLREGLEKAQEPERTWDERVAVLD